MFSRITGSIPTWSGRVHQQRREPLNPSEQGYKVDLDGAFGEEFLEIPVRQPVPQVPAHGDQDHLRREPEASETLNRAAGQEDEDGSFGQPGRSGVWARIARRLGRVALNATVPSEVMSSSRTSSEDATNSGPKHVPD
jgi:hypothetical protein